MQQKLLTETFFLFPSVVAFNPLMRSTTNILIINLAISDLMFVIMCIPFTGDKTFSCLFPDTQYEPPKPTAIFIKILKLSCRSDGKMFFVLCLVHLQPATTYCRTGEFHGPMMSSVFFWERASDVVKFYRSNPLNNHYSS